MAILLTRITFIYEVKFWDKISVYINIVYIFLNIVLKFICDYETEK